MNRGFDPNGVTYIPNRIYDEMLAVLSGPELRALFFIYKKTVASKRVEAIITYEEFCSDKHGSGIRSHATLSLALKELERRGLITRRRLEDPVMHTTLIAYSPSQDVIDGMDL